MRATLNPFSHASFSDTSKPDPQHEYLLSLAQLVFCGYVCGWHAVCVHHAQYHPSLPLGHPTCTATQQASIQTSPPTNHNKHARTHARTPHHTRATPGTDAGKPIDSGAAPSFSLSLRTLAQHPSIATNASVRSCAPTPPVPSHAFLPASQTTAQHSSTAQHSTAANRSKL